MKNEEFGKARTHTHTHETGRRRWVEPSFFAEGHLHTHTHAHAQNTCKKREGVPKPVGRAVLLLDVFAKSACLCGASHGLVARVSDNGQSGDSPCLFEDECDCPICTCELNTMFLSQMGTRTNDSSTRTTRKKSLFRVRSATNQMGDSFPGSWAANHCPEADPHIQADHTKDNDAAFGIKSTMGSLVGVIIFIYIGVAGTGGILPTIIPFVVVCVLLPAGC